MKRAEVTGLVLTHGDRNPATTLEQLANVCHQLVVVQDVNSSPAPLNLPNFPGATDLTVIERPFDSFPGQRNAGIDKARGDWVLSVDSDELLSAELAEAITKLQPQPTDQVYGFPRQEMWRGQQLRAELYCQYHPRLFRSQLRYAPVPEVHEEFAGFDYGTMAHVEAPLIHDVTESLIKLCQKTFGYGQSWQQAHQDDGYGRRRLFRTVSDHLVDQHYWRDGLRGVGMTAVQFAYGLGRYHAGKR